MDQEPPKPTGPVARTDAAPSPKPVAEIKTPAAPFNEASAGVDPRTAAETELWSGRTHWEHFAGRITVWFLGNVLVTVLLGMFASRVESLTWVGTVWIVAAVVGVSGIVVLGRIVLRVLGISFRLTTQRLFIERGILSRTTDQTELIRVDDVRMQQTFVNRFFNIGSITLLTTDTSDRAVIIEGIKDPRPVTEAVRRQMRALRGKSLYVETL